MVSQYNSCLACAGMYQVVNVRTGDIEGGPSAAPKIELVTFFERHRRGIVALCAV